MAVGEADEDEADEREADEPEADEDEADEDADVPEVAGATSAPTPGAPLAPCATGVA